MGRGTALDFWLLCDVPLAIVGESRLPLIAFIGETLLDKCSDFPACEDPCVGRECTFDRAARGDAITLNSVGTMVDCEAMLECSRFLIVRPSDPDRKASKS